MRIAAATNNERTISAHFGRARFFIVFTVKDGQPAARETRTKLNAPIIGSDRENTDSLGDAHQHAHPGRGRHLSRAIDLIGDCDVALSRGMGSAMHRNLMQAGIRPFLTDVADIDQAVAAFVEGRLEERPERIHESGAGAR